MLILNYITHLLLKKSIYLFSLMLFNVIYVLLLYSILDS